MPSYLDPIRRNLTKHYHYNYLARWRKEEHESSRVNSKFFTEPASVVMKKVNIVKVKENIELGIKTAAPLNSSKGLYHENPSEVTSKEVDFLMKFNSYYKEAFVENYEFILRHVSGVFVKVYDIHEFFQWFIMDIQQQQHQQPQLKY